jgi:hypothetical protein
MVFSVLCVPCGFALIVDRRRILRPDLEPLRIFVRFVVPTGFCAVCVCSAVIGVSRYRAAAAAC